MEIKVDRNIYSDSCISKVVYLLSEKFSIARTFVNNYEILTIIHKTDDDFDVNDFFYKNRHKAQRKAKFYINKCRSASCMQGGLKQASA